MNQSIVRMLVLVACVAAMPVWAQMEKGDKEIGFSGLFLVNHKPVSGVGTLIGSYGVYLEKNHYFGVDLGPSFTFGNGSNDVTGIFNAKYRYLFGSKNNKVFPFVGLLGGVNASKQTLGLAGGEVGFKAFTSQKVSFEMAYQFNALFGSGISGGLERTNSQVLLGLKYIF